MHERTKQTIRRALQLAIEHGAVSPAEYAAARQAIESTPTTKGFDQPELGGYMLVEYLYARAIEAEEDPPACAREWREVEVAMAECRPEEHQRLRALQARSHELAAECHVAARRWWQRHHDVDAERAEAT